MTDSGSNNVFGFVVDTSDGFLTMIAGSPFAAGNIPVGITVDPSSKYLYVGNYGSNSVSAYAINAGSGALAPVPGSPFAAAGPPVGLAFDPKGKFVYVTLSSGSVAAYSSNAPNGALAPVPGSPFATGGVPAGVTVDQTDKFVYVTNCSSNGIFGFSINAATGALTAVPGSPFGETCPLGIVADPVGKFVFVTSYNPKFFNGPITTLSINAGSGALTTVANTVDLFDSGVNVDPKGEFLYATYYCPEAGFFDCLPEVGSFAIDGASGALTPLEGFPSIVPFNTGGLAVDKQGKFTYSAAEPPLPPGPNGLYVYGYQNAGGPMFPIDIGASPTPIPGAAPQTAFFQGIPSVAVAETH